MTLKKIGIYFPQKTHLFLIFVNKEIFFQMEFKIFFIISEGSFERQSKT